MLFSFTRALIPQRASAPRKRDRATIVRPCGTRVYSFQRRCRCRVYAGYGPERAALPPERQPRRVRSASQEAKHPTPGRNARVSLFLVQRRRDTEARKGVRAAGLHGRNLVLREQERFSVELPGSVWQRTHCRGPSTSRSSLTCRMKFQRRFAQGDSGKVSGRKQHVSAGCICQDVLLRN